MTPDLQRFEKVLDEILDTFGSMAQKVIHRNPSWTELTELLTEDELIIYAGFVNSTLRHTSARLRVLDAGC